MKQMKTRFSFFDQAKAAAIVGIFETSKPLGNYSAIAVLDDGAGISYGISQFTHRSGALQAVVERYLQTGGQVGILPLRENLANLRSKSAKSIAALAANTRFKAALRAAAITREMRAAQESVAHEMFMLPAIEICERMGFREALSLAVIHDSVVHGSWERIRDRVVIDAGTTGRRDYSYEREWISEYVRRRDDWLGSIPRLRSTRYRTGFFQTQIEHENWILELPLLVNGVRLTEEIARQRGGESDGLETESVELRDSSDTAPAISGVPADNPQRVPAEPTDDPPSGARPALLKTAIPGIEQAGRIVRAVDEQFDEAEAVIQGMVRRRDAVKSIWAAVGGTAWQAIWAIMAFLIGLPGYIWFVAAVAASAFALYYLHRQIALGKIREKSEISKAGR